MASVTVDIWSDILCPFCYLGDVALEKALEQFPHADDVEVRFHSYQLMPELDSEPVPVEDLLVERYGQEQLSQQHAYLQQRGGELGIDFRFSDSKAVNTHSAHELIHLAAERGAGAKVARELFKAHFTEGKNVADIDVLTDVADRCGVNPEEAKQALIRGQYSAGVGADIDRAKQLGIRGVPFFVFNNKYAVNGAQSVATFLDVLGQAWAERS